MIAEETCEKRHWWLIIKKLQQTIYYEMPQPK
jgi:hypothetical protein